jgi:AraC-like DNA-binding protein
MTVRADLGALGEPTFGAVRLDHVFESPVATVRHLYYEAGARIHRHSHDIDVLLYGLGGPLLEYGKAKGIIKRQLTFYPRDYEYSVQFAGPTYVLTVEIARSTLHLPERRPWPEASTSLPATLYNHVWHTLLKIAEGPPCPSMAATLSDLLNKAETFLCRSKPDWLLAVLDHLHVNWRSVHSVRALSTRFGVSRQHICRAFKRHLGVTTQQYGVLLRLDYARGLLWGTGLPIAAIAAETGFSDQSHLTRVLSANNSRTPARLRGIAPPTNRRNEIFEPA